MESTLGYGSDEPLTPGGRLFLHKEMAQVIYCAVGMKHQIDVEALKALAKDSVMIKHPRFCSLMVRDELGVEHWRRTDIELDRHFIIVDDPVGSGDDDHDEAAVNEYLADMSLSSSVLDETKPLWEVHVLKAHRCLILRIHHALGDGISLVSMFLTLGRRVEDPDSLPTIASSSSSSSSRKLIRESSARSSWYQAVAKFVQRVCLTVLHIVEFTLRSLWVRDPKSPISEGDGVELWPRKLATARFQLDDMKLVKRAIPDSTINDVLFGVISGGLCRYLDQKWPGSMRPGMQMTGVAMVNLRKQPGLQALAKMMMENPSIRWGNRFGIVLLPLYYHGNRTSPLDHITKAKEMLDRKKNSLEAIFSCWILDLLMSWFGPKVAGGIYRQIMCNTTFTISNVVGPQEELEQQGNPVTYVKGNISSLPHALTMHMISYAGRAYLQILVAKDIIPDPEFLAECFEGALMDMKAAAVEACSSYKED